LFQESGFGHIPDRLRFVPVPVMRVDDCQKSYRFYITPRMLCAGYATGGKDACNVTFLEDSILDSKILIIIISLLMSPLLGHMPFFWITHKEIGP
jgi:hypothetical protein